MKCSHIAVGMAALALLATQLSAVDSPEKPDDIWILVERSRVAAESIRVDGDKSDWEHLVGFEDSEDERIEDSTRDIKRVSIAPMANYLLVLIETVGEPCSEHEAFWLDVDIFGHKEADVRIGIGSKGRHRVKTFNEKKNSELKSDFETFKISANIGAVVEIKIPYSVLDGHLSQPLTTDPNKEGFRPFVRVNAYTWNAVTSAFPDRGPSVASYHLLDKPYELDSMLPGEQKAPIAIDYPFSDMHFIGNGALGLRAHVGLYAYDFYITDTELGAATRPRSNKNEDYFTWGKTVMAPVKGRVVKAVDHHEDLPPLDKKDKQGNDIQIKTDEGYVVSLYHIQKNSALVEVGSDIEAGKVVGRVGNSGMSGWAHIHLTMQRNNLPKQGLPIALDDVVIGLNPQEEDPWRRSVKNWTIREGYFVRASF